MAVFFNEPDVGRTGKLGLDDRNDKKPISENLTQSFSDTPVIPSFD